MSENKITSVSQLAHFKVKETVWYLRYKSDFEQKFNEYIDLNGDIHYYDWDFDTPRDLHPKDNFSIFGKNLWPKGTILPRVPAKDFVLVMKLLTACPYIHKLRVRKIRRSTKTGEFYYRGKGTDWMPESCLFDTEKAAVLEAKRLSRIIKKWLD